MLKNKIKYAFIMMIVAFAIIVFDSGIRSVVTSPFILFDAKNSTNSTKQILTGYAGIQGDYFLDVGETDSINGRSPVQITLGNTLYNYYNLEDLKQVNPNIVGKQLDVVTRKGVVASFGEGAETTLKSSNLLFNRYEVQLGEDNLAVPLDLHAEFSLLWIIIILVVVLFSPAVYLLVINITYVKINPNSNFSLLELFIRLLVPYLLAFLMPILLNYYFVFGSALLLTNSYIIGLLLSIIVPVVLALKLTILADNYYQKHYLDQLKNEKKDEDDNKGEYGNEEIVFFTKREKIGNLIIVGFLIMDVYVTKYVLSIQIQSLIFYNLFWFFVWVLVLFIIMFIGFHYVQYFTGNYRFAYDEEKLQAGIHTVEERLGSSVHLMVKKDTKDEYNAWVYVMKSLMDKRLHIYVTEGLFKEFNTKEITSIIYHEIGHIKLHHMRYVMLLSSATVLLTGMIIFLGRKISLASGWYHYLFVFVVVIMLGFLIQQWIPNFVSKKLEHKADAYVIRLMEDKRVYINALKKITKLHDDDIEPSRRKEWRESHPSLEKRIDYLNKI
ncbi:M48 family metalloprotease [Virgibacillus sp. C22-A2]|uniref:M48 family metalloprotease n=1 Tax=Virgibacillus tibetensis TaxID=3042313 RepID=A0ABU6KDT0_9BACI|nr:M48 family metalloprotease [Virgibacillus sp. C22-A2]